MNIYPQSNVRRFGIFSLFAVLLVLASACGRGQRGPIKAPDRFDVPDYVEPTDGDLVEVTFTVQDATHDAHLYLFNDETECKGRSWVLTVYRKTESLAERKTVKVRAGKELVVAIEADHMEFGRRFAASYHCGVTMSFTPVAGLSYAVVGGTSTEDCTLSVGQRVSRDGWILLPVSGTRRERISSSKPEEPACRGKAR